jgi:hypothetical protein
MLNSTNGLFAANTSPPTMNSFFHAHPSSVGAYPFTLQHMMMMHHPMATHAMAGGATAVKAG